MRRIIATTFLLLIFVASCRRISESEFEGHKISVDIDNSEGYLSFACLVDTNNISIVQLADHGMIIGKVEDFKEFDQDIYILGEDRKFIGVFSTIGKFIEKFQKLGRAESEYLEITDFAVQDKTLFILDQTSQKINVYDSNGACIRNINIKKIWGNHIFIYHDDIYVINDSSDTEMGRYHIFKIDQSDVITPLLPFKEESGLPSQKPYAYASDCIYYVERMSAKVYKIDENGVTDYLQLCFGKDSMPKKFQSMDARELLQKGVAHRYCLGIEDVFAYNDHLMLVTEKDNTKYYVIFNTISSQVEMIVNGFIVDKGLQIGLTNIFIQKNKLYDMYYADDFISQCKNLLDSKDEYTDEIALHTFLDSISADQNPVIFIYCLKYR